MRNIARFISMLMFMVFTTEAFAKSVDPIKHAAGTAEAQLMMNAFKERTLQKFSSLSVSHQESVLYGMYKMGVKAQNKLDNMNPEKITEKLLSKSKSIVAVDENLSVDESTASDFIAETAPAVDASPAQIQSSQISDLLSASRDALVSVGTPVDAKGKFQALKRNKFLDIIRQIDGDGTEMDGLAKALVAFFFAVIGLLALAAIVIVGLSGAAFGVTGALVAVGVIGLVVIIVLAH